MKRFVAILICMCMVFSACPVFAEEEIVDVFFDGQLMQFDVPARIYGDRTMVPMRAIFERLGAQVEWLEDDELIFAVRDEQIITMKIGQNFLTVQNILTNESRRVDLDVVPMLVNDRTLVPIRAVAESFGCIVDWDDANRDVIITSAE